MQPIDECGLRGGKTFGQEHDNGDHDTDEGLRQPRRCDGGVNRIGQHLGEQHDGDEFATELHAGHGRSSLLLSLFTGFNQAFFMGLFFLLADYFTPGAVERHRAAAFMRERALRLGLPLIVYFLLISPVTIALAATARGRDFFKALICVWTHGLMEPGPLVLRGADLRKPLRSRARSRARPDAVRPAVFPLQYDARARGAWHRRRHVSSAPRLAEGTTLLRLQLGYFASYVVLFAVGCLAAPWPSLDETPAPQRRLWIAIACVTFPLMPIAFVLGGHFGGSRARSPAVGICKQRSTRSGSRSLPEV